MWSESGNPIVKWRCASYGLMSSTALLLPFTAVPESRVQTAVPSTAASAAAHVNFKIVIPQVLYLQVGDLQLGDLQLGGADSRNAGAQTVAVMSNGRNVTLNATLPAADSNARNRSNVILSANVVLRASARKVIAQDTQCALTPIPAAAALPEARNSLNTATQRYICTASTP